MIETRNLENVQVGDTLIWNGRGLAGSKVVTVDRLTKTQIIIGDNRYRKSGGRRVGSDPWNSSNVTIPKESEIEKIHLARRHRELVNRVNDACHINKLRAMSLDTLRKLNKVLETP